MIELQAIDYRIGDQVFTGWLADGSRGQRAPGVLVAHEGPGLTEHPRQRARMLAELGYVAFAVDLYGEKDSALDRAKELVRRLRADRDTLRQRVRAGHDLLAALPQVDAERTAAIGFCFGGMAVLELARSGAPVRAVVGFHADLTNPTPQNAAAVRGKVLVCLGADDPIIDAGQRRAFVDEMIAAKLDWQMVLYGGAGHSFTNRDIDAWKFPGFAYHADADRRSWQAMRLLFDEVLGPVLPPRA
ncbi:MAG TPA: dienelactone hydrolase family protein [Planctomycetota bacterium]|nr:dienelactone hydrolase family protein [Planctomycetota bacterium]